MVFAGEVHVGREDSVWSLLGRSMWGERTSLDSVMCRMLTACFCDDLQEREDTQGMKRVFIFSI